MSTVAPPPLLSILSVVTGEERHLAQAVDSVRGQTSGSWELVLVDDGRSEEIRRIVEKHAGDDRIRLVRREHASRADGVGIAAAVARGAYRAVLAADGRLAPAFCERIAQVLGDRPEIDVLCIDAVPFVGDEHGDEDRPPTFRQRCGITQEPGVGHRVTLGEVLRDTALYSTAAIRAATWDAAQGWSADTSPVESLDMCLRMVAAGSDLRVLPEVLGGYRLDPDEVDHEPADWDEYHAAVERTLVRVGGLTEDPAAVAQLQRTLRDFRYEKALRRSRQAMRRSDSTAARVEAAHAFRARPGLRPAMMWIVLRIVPGGSRTLKQAKAKITAALRSRGGRGRAAQ